MLLGDSATVVGTLLGMVAGWFKGWTAVLIMRAVDTFTAFPFLIMAIGVIAVLGAGVGSMYIALTLSGELAPQPLEEAFLSKRG